MLNNLRLGIRLAILSGLLILLMILSGGLGRSGMNEIGEYQNSLYLDRVVPLQQLSTIQDSLHRIRFRLMDTLSRKEAQNYNEIMEKSFKEVVEMSATIDQLWKEYMATYLTPEEKVLAETFAADYKVYIGYRDQAITHLKKSEFEQAKILLDTKVHETFRKSINGTRELVALQVREAKNLDDKTDTLVEVRSDQIIALIAIAMLFGGIVAWVTTRSITKPLSKLIAIMNQLAIGNTNVDVFGYERGDEVGDIAKTVQVFKENAIQMDKMREEQKEAEVAAAATRKKELMKLADNFEQRVMGVVKGVSSSSTEMQSTAESMSHIAQETSAQAASVAAASTQASTNVETVATATEELSASVAEISSRVADAARIAQKAADASSATGETVGKLAVASAKIGEVVELINTIASQTNLLALNATIEAARAGDAGKGFAVVASEVKGLANQTAKATEEIAGQISAVQNETNNAVQAIKMIADVINQVRDISASISAAVEEQGSATQEIARNIQQASAGTHEVSNSITSVTDAAAQTGSAASQVLSTAQELAQNADALHREVNSFLSNIRAG